jgi:hypothetical protein
MALTYLLGKASAKTLKVNPNIPLILVLLRKVNSSYHFLLLVMDKVEFKHSKKAKFALFCMELCVEEIALGDCMSRLRVALVILGDVMLFIAVILLLQIDQLVNSTLYSYGLVFSSDWAQPYWLLLRVSLFLFVAVIFLISVVELSHSAFQEDQA